MASPVTIDTTYLGKYPELGRGPMPKVEGLVVHHTGADTSVQSVINGWVGSKGATGAQFVMDRSGKVYQILPDGTRANQTIKSWNPNIPWASNSTTQGIEIMAKDDKDVTPAQAAALVAFAKQQAAKYGYDPATHVVGHGEINGSGAPKGTPGTYLRQPTEGMTAVNALRADLSGSPSSQTASAYANPPTPPVDPRSSALSAISAATKPPNNTLSANAGDSLAFNPVRGGPSMSDGLTIGNMDAAMFPDGMMHPLMTPNASANFDAPPTFASTNAPGQVGQSPMIPSGSGSSSMAMNDPGRNAHISSPADASRFYADFGLPTASTGPSGSGSSSMAQNDRLSPSGSGASIMMMNDPAPHGITASGSGAAATGQPGLTGGAVHLPPASGVTGSASGGIGQGAAASGTAYFPGSLNHELYPNGEPTYKGTGPLSDIPSWANHNAPYSVTYPPAATADNPGTMLGGAVRQVPSSALQPLANGLSALSGAYGSSSSGSSSSSPSPSNDDSWATLLHSLTTASPSVSGMSAGDLASAAAPSPVRTLNPAYTAWLNSAGAPVGVKANAIGMIGQGGFASGAINMGMHPALAPPAAAPRGPAPAQYIYTQPPQAQPTPPPPPRPIAVSNGYNYMPNGSGGYTNVGQQNNALTPAQVYDLANHGQSSSGNSSSLSSLSSRG